MHCDFFFSVADLILMKFLLKNRSLESQHKEKHGFPYKPKKRPRTELLGTADLTNKRVQKLKKQKVGGKWSS